MPIDDLAKKVIDAIQGKPDAVKAISDALATGDANRIRESIRAHAGIDITDDETQAIVEKVQANPSAPAAYFT